MVVNYCAYYEYCVLKYGSGTVYGTSTDVRYAWVILCLMCEFCSVIFVHFMLFIVLMFGFTSEYKVFNYVMSRAR